MIPDFLAIGHITLDLFDQASRMGGTASYAAVTAQRLGLVTAVVTAAGPELNLKEELPAIEIAAVPSRKTTCFRNMYPPQGRIQQIVALAEPISVSAVPKEWRHAKLVLLGPVVHEIDESFLDFFPDSFLALSPQGWLRAWDNSGRVVPRVGLPKSRAISKAGVVMVSEEDLSGEAAAFLPLLQELPLAIITRGPKGATLFQKGQILDLPPRPTQALDPTGAGDVFAAAFMVKYAQTQDPVQSTQFGQVAASFSTEAPGLAGIPDREKVENWIKAHASDLGLG